MYLRRASRDGRNVRRATRLAVAFESVGESPNVEADLARYADDRSTRMYATAIAYCRIFLRGESFTMFKGGDVATALLFPTERIFEGFVGRSLRGRVMRGGKRRRVTLKARG